MLLGRQLTRIEPSHRAGEPFEPRLVGAVLAGSATEFADIQLHLFADSAEAVCMHLMDRRFAYEVSERRVRLTAERQVPIPTVRFEVGEETIEAFVFPREGIRQAPVSPVDGRPMRRAGMQEVAELGGYPEPLATRPV